MNLNRDKQPKKKSSKKNKVYTDQNVFGIERYKGRFFPFIEEDLYIFYIINDNLSTHKIVEKQRQLNVIPLIFDSEKYLILAIIKFDCNKKKFYLLDENQKEGKEYKKLADSFLDIRNNLNKVADYKLSSSVNQIQKNCFIARDLRILNIDSNTDYGNILGEKDFRYGIKSEEKLIKFHNFKNERVHMFENGFNNTNRINSHIKPLPKKINQDKQKMEQDVKKPIVHPLPKSQPIKNYAPPLDNKMRKNPVKAPVAQKLKIPRNPVNRDDQIIINRVPVDNKKRKIQEEDPSIQPNKNFVPNKKIREDTNTCKNAQEAPLSNPVMEPVQEEQEEDEMEFLSCVDEEDDQQEGDDMETNQDDVDEKMIGKQDKGDGDDLLVSESALQEIVQSLSQEFQEFDDNLQRKEVYEMIQVEKEISDDHKCEIQEMEDPPKPQTIQEEEIREISQHNHKTLIDTVDQPILQQLDNKIQIEERENDVLRIEEEENRDIDDFRDKLNEKLEEIHKSKFFIETTDTEEIKEILIKNGFKVSRYPGEEGHFRFCYKKIWTKQEKQVGFLKISVGPGYYTLENVKEEFKTLQLLYAHATKITKN